MCKAPNRAQHTVGPHVVVLLLWLPPVLPAALPANTMTLRWASEEGGRASDRRTQQGPSACPVLFPMPFVSPHLYWTAATTVSLNHFSSCPSRAGNSGLTSHERTVTELKIEVSLDWSRGLCGALMAGPAGSAHPGRAGLWAAGAAALPPRGKLGFPWCRSPEGMCPQPLLLARGY